MHRRTFLTGLFGIAAAGVGASLATRAEALTIVPNDDPARAPDAAKAEAGQGDKLAERLPADAKIEPVQYRRRYYRRPAYRRPYRWRPVRRRQVCRTTWTRRGRKRVCTWR